MLVVFPYSLVDQKLAVKLAQWIAELGKNPTHEVLIVRDHRCNPALDQSIRAALISSFSAVETIDVTDDVYNQWPHSANLMFRNAAKHIQYTRPRFWLWMEADAVPMRSDWCDLLEAEYLEAGKPFSGDLVSVHTPELDVEDHLSGVAIYPGVITDHAGLAVVTLELAWDMACREQTVPNMHQSKYLSHAWRHPTFEGMEQVQREIYAIKPECVLFHASKDGSLIDILRAERNKTLPVPVLAEKPLLTPRVDEAGNQARESTGKEPLNSVDSRGGQFISGPGSQPNAATGQGSGAGDSFTCDILIKSYPPDYELLGYCLRSIEKFASGFRQVILIIPKQAEGEIQACPDRIPLKWVEVEETGEGYLFQQAVKINAHEYTDADYILHIDSDTMLTKPVTPQTFFREVFKRGLGDVTQGIIGKPITEKRPVWLMTPYEQTETPWQPFTEKFIGEPVQFEFMRRFPMLIPRSLHVSADVFCRVRHKMSLAQYILSQPHRAFSEFNALGALAYSRARNEFSWLDTTKEELPELVAIQRWSHEPLTDAIRDEMEKILAAAGSGSATTQTESRSASPLNDPGIPLLGASRSVDTEGADNGAASIRQTAAGHWIINGDTHISAWVEEKGQLQHDFQTLPLILAEIQPGNTVVDVGANIGDSTAPFLEKVGPSGRVYAFEPNLDAYECLKRNCERAISVPVALGDPVDDFQVVTLNPHDNAGARHISADVDGGVRITSLDMAALNLISCDFIKIDVEGYELNVLRGAEQTISKFRPKMAIEINEGALRRQGTSQIEVFEWLNSHAYQWWPLVPPNLEQELPQYDILAKPMAHKQLTEPRAHSENLEPLTKERLQEIAAALRFEVVPWEHKDESVAEIRRLCARLKEFETCPAYTALVRKHLKSAKVTR